MRTIPAVLLVLGICLGLGGCPPENFDNVLPITQGDVNRILNREGLSAQEMRAELATFGVSPRTINALLADERLGNQYGGDLRSAYTQVVEPDLTALTPDEVQIYGDEASAVDEADDLDVTLSDAEAQAVVDFFVSNNLSSPADVEQELQNGEPAGVPDGMIRALFVDFDSSVLLPRLP